MMRWKYTLIAASLMLAAPAISEAGVFGRNPCGPFSGRFGGGFGGGGAGGQAGSRVGAFFGAIGDAIANSPGPVWPQKEGHGGFGFFQPPFQASPWYLYWPYDQHFQLPAPIHSPYFAPHLYGHPSMNQYFPPPHPAPGAPPANPAAPVPPPAK